MNTTESISSAISTNIIPTYEQSTVVIGFTYNWKVHVKDLFSDHDVTSPPFHCPDQNTGRWQLEMIGCEDEGGELCVRLGLRRLPSSPPMKGRVKFSIDGSEFSSVEVTKEFSQLEPSEISSVMYALPLTVITKWANGKIEDQNLTVYCKMWLFLPSIVLPMIDVQTEEEKAVLAKLEREDLWSSTVRMGDCDAVIRCQNVAMKDEKFYDRVKYSKEVAEDSGQETLNKELVGEPQNGMQTIRTTPLFTPYEVDYKKAVARTPSRKLSSIRGRTNSETRCGDDSRKNTARPTSILAVRASKQRERGVDASSLYHSAHRHIDSHLLSDCDSTTSFALSERRSDSDLDEQDILASNMRGWIVEPSGGCCGDELSVPRDEHSKKGMRAPSVMRSNGSNFRDGPFTDFPIHRSILRHRSAVFRQMLSDQSLNLISVYDVDSDVMNELLRFLYTGAVSQDAFPKMAEGLLFVSSKYDVPHLKGQCEYVLSGQLSTANVCRLMLAASQNGADILKRNVISFATKEHQDVFRSPEYREFQLQHSGLAKELMLSVFSTVTAS